MTYQICSLYLNSTLEELSCYLTLNCVYVLKFLKFFLMQSFNDFGNQVLPIDVEMITALSLIL